MDAFARGDSGKKQRKTGKIWSRPVENLWIRSTILWISLKNPQKNNFSD